MEDRPARALTPEEKALIDQLVEALDKNRMTHYTVLGIGRDADAQTIRHAYFNQSKRWHPDLYHQIDLGPYRARVEKIFSAINLAYQVLKQARTRAKYDRELQGNEEALRRERAQQRNNEEMLDRLLAAREQGQLTHYDILGVRTDASQLEVRHAYYEALGRWSPTRPGVVGNDRRDDLERLLEALGEAYAVLSDPHRREGYDRYHRFFDVDDVVEPAPKRAVLRDDAARRTAALHRAMGGAAPASVGNRPLRATRQNEAQDTTAAVEGAEVWALNAHAQQRGRFRDTADVLSYGVKLGLGKAAQQKALEALQERVPGLTHPALVAGLKMGLPLIGAELSQRIQDEGVSERVRSASEGMLLVNTIDTTADVVNTLAEMAVPFLQTLLEVFGVAGADAEQSARQLVEDLDLEGVVLTEQEKVEDAG